MRDQQHNKQMKCVDCCLYSTNIFVEEPSFLGFTSILSQTSKNKLSLPCLANMSAQASICRLKSLKNVDSKSLISFKKKIINKEIKLTYMFAFFLRIYAPNSCLHLEKERKINQEHLP